jgi:transposase-like protein
MRKSRFTEEQISFALRQAETGTPVAEVIRRMGVSEQTFYRWSCTGALARESCVGSSSSRTRTAS